MVGELSERGKRLRLPRPALKRVRAEIAECERLSDLTFGKPERERLLKRFHTLLTEAHCIEKRIAALEQERP